MAKYDTLKSYCKAKNLFIYFIAEIFQLNIVAQKALLQNKLIKMLLMEYSEYG